MDIDPEILKRSVDSVDKMLGKFSAAVDGVTDRLNKVSKNIGGYGTFGKPFGMIDSRIDKFLERLELIQKLDKTIINYGTRLESLKKDKTLKGLSETYGTKLFGNTIIKAFKAGGPILADEFNLAARMEAVGKDSGSFFEFVKDFRSLTGKNVNQQKDLVATIKQNFSRSDDLITAIQKLTSDLQKSAIFAPKLSSNLVKLIADATAGNTGLETQFSEFFQSLLNESDLARLGALGPEIQQLVKEFNIGVATGKATSADLFNFVKKFSESSQVAQYSDLSKYFAETEGIFGIARNISDSLLGEFSQKTILLNNAVEGTIAAQKEALNLPTNMSAGYNNALKQLEITVDIVDSKMKIFGFSLESLADTVNRLSTSDVELLRRIEDISSAFGLAKLGLENIWDILRDWLDLLSKKKDDKLKCGICDLGASCERPVYVKICGDIGGVGAPVPAPVGIPPKSLEAKEKKDNTKEKDKKDVNYRDWIKNIVPVAVGAEILRRILGKPKVPKIDPMEKDFWKKMNEPAKIKELPEIDRGLKKNRPKPIEISNPRLATDVEPVKVSSKIEMNTPKVPETIEAKPIDVKRTNLTGKFAGPLLGLLNLLTTMEAVGGTIDKTSELSPEKIEKQYSEYTQEAVKMRVKGGVEYEKFRAGRESEVDKALQTYDYKVRDALMRLDPQNYKIAEEEKFNKQMEALRAIESAIKNNGLDVRYDVRYTGSPEIDMRGVL